MGLQKFMKNYSAFHSKDVLSNYKRLSSIKAKKTYETLQKQ